MDTDEQSIAERPSSRHGRAVAVGVTGVIWAGLVVLVGLMVNPRHAQWGDWVYSCWFGGAVFGIIWVLLFYFVPLRRWRASGQADGFVVEVDPATQDLFCIDCGYDLRSIASERCPECGWVIDWSGLRRVISRGRIGKSWGGGGRFGGRRLSGTLRGKELAREVVRPVEDRDARRFATVVGGVLALPLVIAACVATASEGSNVFNPMAWPRDQRNTWSPPSPPGDWMMPLAAGLTLKFVVPLGILLAAWLAAAKQRDVVWAGR